ncbi:hypothetical protein ACFYT4_10765 [Streptomyces sp. NPDC004609]|uniref:hypothetical protein n=1 Tax=Streptomyces sp. NPDC004609 TaxID=3364704 RepID=UPI0036D0F803
MISGQTRKQADVRRMLGTPHLPVPADLAARAREQGTRLLRRRRALRATAWTLLLAAVIAFTAWAAVAEPWEGQPTRTTPPVVGV